MKYRLQLGRFVRHQTHHRLRPSHAAQLVDHAEHRVELRANEHLVQINDEPGVQHIDIDPDAGRGGVGWFDSAGHTSRIAPPLLIFG